MILQPAVIALLFICLVAASIVLYASFRGAMILSRWDMGSGSEEQLVLERSTYLISMGLSYVLAFEGGSLFLYIFTADALHPLFTGAMCAAGTLNVNRYGYPLLLLKLAGSILAGLWLIINFTDNRAYDYPLIRPKYALLLFLAPLFVAESILSVAYFVNLKGDVITSCCGSLFSAGGRGVASGMSAVPVKTAMTAFKGSLALTFTLGVLFLLGKAPGLGGLFSLAAGLTFPVSLMSLISFISLYVYELPTHHCPFCILQGGYGYVGYLLYASLITGVISGLGVGVLMPFRGVRSLERSLPVTQGRLTATCLISYFVFAGVSVGQMLFSGLKLVE
jgi:hypothetical protein